MTGLSVYLRSVLDMTIDTVRYNSSWRQKYYNFIMSFKSIIKGQDIKTCI